MRLLRLRKMTWVILLWSGIMFAWIVAATASSPASDCATDASVTSGILTKQECIDASNAGTGIGVGLIFVLWFLGFVALALVWLMSRPRHRSCPACGEDVRKGRTTCNRCGYDFAAAAPGRAIPAPPT
jgi:hypothetical protein